MCMEMGLQHYVNGCRGVFSLGMRSLKWLRSWVLNNGWGNQFLRMYLRFYWTDVRVCKCKEGYVTTMIKLCSFRIYFTHWRISYTMK